MLFLAGGACVLADRSEIKTETTDVVLKAIDSRTSIRAYEPNKAIGKDTIEAILKAGMAAPTAMNKQPWAFVVVDNKTLLKELADSLPHAKMTASASLAIVVCGDTTKMIPGKFAQYWIQDTSAATENMLIAINAFGLGAVWTGVYPDMNHCEAVRGILNLPANIIPLNVIPIGYPAEPNRPKDKWNLDNIYYNDSYKAQNK